MLRGFLVGVWLGMFALLSLVAYSYKNKSDKCRNELITLENKNLILLDSLKKREILLLDYQKQKPKIEEKIITKYKIIKQKDESCKAFREGVDEIVGAFYRSNPP